MKYNLQQISDRLEIEDLLVEYAEAVDQCDVDRLDAVFTHDAHVDYSAFGGVVGSYAEAKTFLADSLPVFKNTQHAVSNQHIKLDGDKATGKIMCFNPMELELEPGKPQVFFIGLWYNDEYVRTEKGWRIASRSETKSWTYNTPDFLNFD